MKINKPTIIVTGDATGDMLYRSASGELSRLGIGDAYGVLSVNGTETAPQWTTSGDLTETTSSILTITGGTRATIGSGTSIQVKKASVSQDGYLGKDNWTTFNAKEPAVTKGNLTETSSSILIFSGSTSNNVIGNGTAIQVKKASAIQDGYLGKNDFTSFSNSIHNPVTLNASAITGGLSLNSQELSFRAATASVDGYLSRTDFTDFYGRTRGDDSPAYGFIPGFIPALSFSDSTYLVTLTDPSGGWKYARTGVRCNITGNKTVRLVADPGGNPAPDANTYYIYIDAIDGTLTSSTSSWTLEDTKVPVAIVYWNDTLTPKYFLADERHTTAISRRYHWEHHFSDGSELISGGNISGYVISDLAPTSDAYNTFGIEETIFADEDIKVTLAALPDPNGTDLAYTTLTRNSTTSYVHGTSAVPFTYTNSGYINWSNGGTSVEGTTGKFYTSYLLLTNFADAGRYMLISGRAEFSSFAEAATEDIGLFNWDGFPITECIIAYRFVWGTNSTYTTKGKVRLEGVNGIMLGRVSLIIKTFDLPIRVLDDLLDVTLTSPTVDQSLFFNGSKWVNKTGLVSGGLGIEFFSDDAMLIDKAAGQSAYTVESLLKIPRTAAEQAQVVESVTTTTTPIILEAYLYNAALNRTQLDAGTWGFYIYCSANSANNSPQIDKNIYRVIQGVGTLVMTSSGTTRTATASTGTPFAAGDGTADVSTCGYLQTPNGFFPITTGAVGANAKVAAVTTLTGYTNEGTGTPIPAGNWKVWKKLFGVNTGNITYLNTSYGLITKQSVQAVHTLTADGSDRLGEVVFARSSNTGRIIYYVHNGEINASHIQTPLITLHNNLAGLNLGDYQHFTAAQATDLTDGGTTTLHSHTIPVPTTITVAVEATDTSSFPLLVTAGTGDLGPKTSTGWGLSTAHAYTGTGTATSGLPRMFLGTNAPSGDDSALLICRAIAGTDLFSHGVRDESTFTSLTTGAYASYDAHITVNGTITYNHMHGFQCRSIYAGSGTLNAWQAFTSNPVINSGTAANVVGLHIYNAVGAGIVTYQVGIYIDELTKGATNNYAIFSPGATKSWHAGQLQIGVGGIYSIVGIIQMTNIWSDSVSNSTAVGIGVPSSSYPGAYLSAFGHNAGQHLVSSGNNFNTFIGWSTGVTATTGSSNTYIGAGAGWVGNGSGNICLGKYAGFYETGSNKLFIDNDQRVSEADARVKALVYGIFAAAVADQSLTVNGALLVEGNHIGVNCDAYARTVFQDVNNGQVTISSPSASADTVTKLTFSTPAYAGAGANAGIGVKWTAGGTEMMFGTSNTYTGISNTALTISPAGIVAMNIAAEASDQTCYPLFVTAATGVLAPKTHATFGFDAANGFLGVGTATPGAKIHAFTNSSAWAAIFGDTTNSNLRVTGTFESGTGASVIQSYIGPSANVLGINPLGGNVGILNYDPQYTLEVSGYVAQTFCANLAAAAWMSNRARNTRASKTIVQDGDLVGSFYFQGWDGYNFIPLAQIYASVAGTPGSGDMPGKLIFATTADGASTPTSRVVIDQAGNFGIGTVDLDGTPAIGRLIVESAGNSSSTNIFVGRDSDHANQFVLNSDGEITTGSWHATTITYDHGGTGLTAYPKKTIVLPAASAALGTTTPATRETRELTTNKQVIDVLKFPHASVGIAWWSFLLPNSYDGGVINAKISYMNVATTDGYNFLFSLSAGCAADGNPLDLTMGNVQELVTVVGDTIEDLKIGSWSTGVTPSGTPAGGKLLFIKLQRDPTDTAHDTTVLDAYVLGLKLEYTTNSWSD